MKQKKCFILSQALRSSRLKIATVLAFCGSFFKRTLPGISLWETMLVLIIAAVLMGSMLKGWNLVERAKILSLCEQSRAYVTAARSFHEQYGFLPPPAEVWEHLFHEGVIKKPDRSDGQGHTYPSSPLGGGFLVVQENLQDQTGWWIVLAEGYANGKPSRSLLTPSQAMVLAKNLGDGTPFSPDCIVTEGPDVQEGSCIKGQAFNLENKKRSCIVYFFLCP